MVEELQNTDEELMKLQRCDMLDGVDSDLANAHFEFRLHDSLQMRVRQIVDPTKRRAPVRISAQT